MSFWKTPQKDNSFAEWLLRLWRGWYYFNPKAYGRPIQKSEKTRRRKEQAQQEENSFAEGVRRGAEEARRRAKERSSWRDEDDQARRKAEEARRRYEEEKEIRRSAEDEQARQKEQARRHAEKEQTRKKAEEEQTRRRYEDEQSMYNSTVNDEIQRCFDIFELPYSASFIDVKKRYLMRVKFYHPDKQSSSDDDVREYANQKTKELNNAFHMLKNQFFNVRGKQDG